MEEIKDTKQATVRITYDGRVHKRYHGPCAKERFENEVRVLRYLAKQGCKFVPQLLEVEEETRSIVTTSCGRVVDRVSEEKLRSLFMELEQYGVRHEDAFQRNVTYSQRLGRFCLIDFEFATILATGEGLTVQEVEAQRKGDYERKRD
ncbi:MAG: serine/threonine protein phosphatase [Opitutales bacterium]